jgi:hypothetical protein
MKAPIAQAAADAASAPGYFFLILWVIEIVKLIFKKLGFRLGPDLVIPSSGDLSIKIG